MTEVGVDKLGGSLRVLSIERDRAQAIGVEAGCQPASDGFPRAGQRRQLKHRVVSVSRSDFDEARLLVELERGLYNALKVHRAEVQRLAVGVELRLEGGQLGVEFPFAAEHLVD